MDAARIRTRLAPNVPWSTLATLVFSFFAVGVTVSVALIDRGTPATIIVGASILVFSATSELAYVAVRDANGAAIAAVLSGWLVASRFGLLATSLGARFGGGFAERALAAICTFDPNVALAVDKQTPIEVRRAFWWATAAMTIGWFIGTGVGLLVGNVLDDVAAYGVDAVFPAALLAIIGPMLRRRDGRAAAVVGGLVCVALTPFTPGGVPILASVVGAFFAVAAFKSGVDSSVEPDEGISS